MIRDEPFFFCKSELIYKRKYGIKSFTTNSLNGAVAQLGECLNGIQKVEGSNPFSSIFANRLF